MFFYVENNLMKLRIIINKNFYKGSVWRLEIIVRLERFLTNSIRNGLI